MDNDKKITIKDVARMAGVSKGTVDRVIHGRGEVSKKSKAKVEEVIQRIGYRPNIYASLLASKKRFTVVCLFPGSSPGEYWQLVDGGVKAAGEMAAQHNVELVSVHYDQFDAESFRKACAQVLDMQPAAVVLAPIFRDDTLEFTRELEQQGASCVMVDSKLDEAPYLAYFGMPMADSGKLGASLLMSKGPAAQIANFRIERGASPNDNPTLKRREGFMQYMAERYPGTTILNEFIRPYDPAYNTKVLDRFFENHPQVRHIITFNSRVHLVADYLAKRGIDDAVVVGYDILEKNIAALKAGTIDYLIVQRTETQVYRGISAIVDHLILKQEPAARDNYMSMDILTALNVEYYTDTL